MILDEIVASTRKRIGLAKENISCEALRREALASTRKPVDFREALARPGMSFICEVKKASPSKGLIAKSFPYREIALEYEKAGAAAISVLTEPEYFQGSNTYLTEIKQEVSIPVLRKDFTIDAYQIYEAKVIGADAILLICALLDTETLRKFIEIADELGLSALVEAHNEAEIESALAAGATVIGVNNRDLKTFEVDISLCTRLRELVPPEVIFVAESGIKTPEDIEVLCDAGVDAVLVGETLMRSADKKTMLDALRGNTEGCDKVNSINGRLSGDSI